MAHKNEMGRAANGTGTLRQKIVKRNGKKYSCWEGRVTVGYDPQTGKQIQKSVSGKNKKDVAQRMQQLAVEVKQETYTVPTKMTVQDWLTIWNTEYIGDVKESTAFLYTQYISKYIIPGLGNLKLDTLRTPSIQAFYNNLFHPQNEKKPLSAKTIKISMAYSTRRSSKLFLLDISAQTLQLPANLHGQRRKRYTH